MNTLRNTLLSAAILLAVAAPAQADTEQFSYRFVDGELLTGTFTGRASAGGYTDIDDVHAWFNGVAVAGGATLYAASYLADGTLTPGSARISPQVMANNFFLSDRSVADSAAINVEIGFVTGGDGVTVIAYSMPGVGSSTSDIFLNDLADTSYSTGPNYFKVAHGLTPQWHVSAVSPVPEPMPAAMWSAGLALLIYGWRQQAKKPLRTVSAAAA